MPRIDDYKKAKELAKAKLSDINPETMADCSGAVFGTGPDKKKYLSLKYLNNDIKIRLPISEIIYNDSGEELPIHQQVLILHYLYGAVSSKGVAPTGEWVSFQDIPDGRFYLGAFVRRAKDPLIKAFGHKPENLVEISSKAYEASLLEYGDFSVIVKPFPLVPMALVLWKGDEEFPPDGNILFDVNISKILSAEDIAWLAGMVIYPLIGMAKS